ncbi:MAG: hypothetical protein A3E26_01050 [Chlamydiae bacterium RIFCSPHIGHO2_12_FULL_49_32]|nr:MAG: hypothetical protein A3E26_01050 [Chlamydiae bacterium RIFCSPHIGHO2_12_FULL_49_32]
MIQNLAYLVLALLGLGFLIFIHELGHYFMARRAKMTVEVFSIGFGKPLCSWNWQGVKWQIGVLPLGGFVRIKGMERKKGVDNLYLIPDGYFGKSPWQRIKVALMGPLVNLLFGLFAFSLIWLSGGREKFFSEKTRLIGWVDPHSKLYELEVRPGDELLRLNHRSYGGAEDLLYAAVLDGKDAVIQGYKINYFKGLKEEFDYKLPTYPHPGGVVQNVFTMGIISPAAYLLYDRSSEGGENRLPQGSPMKESGIQYKDRIIWADGELVFSQRHLIHLVNQSTTLLTVQREGRSFVARVLRLKVSDLYLGVFEKGELDDWRDEAKLKERLQDLYFIPYNLSSTAVVENALSFLGADAKEHCPETVARSEIDTLLQKGDRILAVDGKAISLTSELLSELQQRRVCLIVQHEEKWPVVSWKRADADFFSGISWQDLSRMIQSLGTENPLSQSDSLRFLHPVVPKTMMELSLNPGQKAAFLNEWESQKKEISAIKDPKERERVLRLFEREQKRLLLGINLRDRVISYNPDPFSMTYQVFAQVGRTLVGLFTGALHPKHLAGPVGIVQAIHYGWSVGIQEALYWLGLISLNLGLLNFLPLPVLDGGHICFSLYEIITKKRVDPKIIEKIIIPFFILIVLFFIYMVYSDLSKLFTYWLK